VTCGETITRSVTLANDLVDCPGDGLVVGADRITIDLGGHTIDGPVTAGQPCEPPPPRTSVGIQNDAGHDRITIRDGTIQQFPRGIGAGGDVTGRMTGMSDSRIHDLTVRETRFVGITLFGGDGDAVSEGNRLERTTVLDTACGAAFFFNTLRGSRITANRMERAFAGIVVCCSRTADRNLVAGNVVTATGPGVVVFDSERNRVRHNRVHDVEGPGVLVAGASSRSLVDANRLTRTGGPGVLVEAVDEQGDRRVPTGVVVAGNRMTSTWDGVVVGEADGAVVRRNAISGRTCGDPARCGWGVAIDGASDVLVAANTIVGKEDEGVLVGVPPDQEPSPRAVERNVVSGNRVVGGGVDGIVVSANAVDTLLRANTALRNGDDGIEVLSPSTTVARNRAFRNAGLGIEAPAGVLDAGGNRAGGNGDPAQCTGVTCRP
jgi:hypothetical protein